MDYSIDDYTIEVATVVDEIAKVKCCTNPPVGHPLETLASLGRIHNKTNYEKTYKEVELVEEPKLLQTEPKHHHFIELETAEKYGRLYPELYKQLCSTGLLSPDDKPKSGIILMKEQMKGNAKKLSLKKVQIQETISTPHQEAIRYIIEISLKDCSANDIKEIYTANEMLNKLPYQRQNSGAQVIDKAWAVKEIDKFLYYQSISNSVKKAVAKQATHFAASFDDFTKVANIFVDNILAQAEIIVNNWKYANIDSFMEHVIAKGLTVKDKRHLTTSNIPFDKANSEDLKKAAHFFCESARLESIVARDPAAKMEYDGGEDDDEDCCCF